MTVRQIELNKMKNKIDDVFKTLEQVDNFYKDKHPMKFLVKNAGTAVMAIARELETGIMLEEQNIGDYRMVSTSEEAK